ncbi:Uncharacterised protein [Legionella pneumophila]|uniref:hypothetical protein n=1 Tax=Legionella pneumophila TaxID=446 RepID=UPI000770B18D|nr:hypothetical protein [Legionella pneumophila]HAT9531501.1 hypothetical protein [Legionella pneumophila subsp. pneumophila]CZH45473.1 Uncharacterised protein [Legionella pneumophila]CZI71377.1 Uncharacterised protein [Legionella pneumophila]HAU0766897.1 hypothetical protein [Legionella pneumophila]HAU0991271.1 hypothetical protein [Legionella pneumophila]
MPVILRISLLAVAVTLILWGMSLLTQETKILAYWLWPDAPWLSHVFMASAFLLVLALMHIAAFLSN